MNAIWTRPQVREVFCVSERKLDVLFHTSNLTKFLHAETVFRRSGIPLRHFRSLTEPYDEDYSGGSEALLTRAIAQILQTVGSQSVFFVEDTSLRIDALSRGDDDFPGLAVKEWFARASFRELDSQLRDRGGNRQATVKSDIALHLPGLSRPILFHGQSEGLVAPSAPRFPENSRYPWLTPNSFNGWFIPKGCSRRLGEMKLEESWQYDFRTQALESLLSRLEEYAAVLNLSPHAFTRTKPASPLGELRLFPESPVLVVVGKTCAGKSTFGAAAERKRFLWAEASAVLRTLRSEYANAPRGDAEFARIALREMGPDVVAKRVLALFGREVARGLVITGFRTIEELETIRKAIPYAKVILVEASERLRYQRHLTRGRNKAVQKLEDFRLHDIEQWKFGLLRVAEDFADVRIRNEGTLDDFWNRAGLLLDGETRAIAGVSHKVRPRHGQSENQLFRCLSALQTGGRALSCDEVQIITRSTGNEILHNNVNKVLKRVPELATRYEQKDDRVRYCITDAGRAYIRYMNDWAARAGPAGAD